MKVRKVNRYTVHYKKPKTYKQPKAKRQLDMHKTLLDRDFAVYSILKHPHTSEKAMKQVEDLNTLVFICRLTATKPQIKRAFHELYKAKPRKVNTLITTKGQKKAYIKLDPEDDALELANKIGII